MVILLLFLFCMDFRFLCLLHGTSTTCGQTESSFMENLMVQRRLQSPTGQKEEACWAAPVRLKGGALSDSVRDYFTSDSSFNPILISLDKIFTTKLITED